MRMRGKINPVLLTHKIVIAVSCPKVAGRVPVNWFKYSPLDEMACHSPQYTCNVSGVK